MNRPPRPESPSRVLQQLDNVGPRVAGDLIRLGITEPEMLKGRDPFRMYADICRKDGVRHDPCLLDVFMAIVDHANGRPSQPWWHFTDRRKAELKKRGRA
ncbi:MAG: helix-hairpin-helix domain-containing protein [Planctomycetia bacterium]|nr:helix-hairpin-helix domain-containing protein [Planctomycetia bacterium]